MKKLNLPFILLISFYKKFVSPFLPHVCRFDPTCSSYAQFCYKNFSWHKATCLSVWRLLRCHPFCEGGFDPVPHTDKNHTRQKICC